MNRDAQQDIDMNFPFLYDVFNEDSDDLPLKQHFFLRQTKQCKEVLEVGAGTGNISFFLADNNIDIACIEPSPTVLNVLFTKIIQSPVSRKHVTVFPGIVEEVTSNKKFECIIVPNLMNLIIEEDNREDIMQKISECLSQTGKLIINFFPILTLTDHSSIKAISSITYNHLNLPLTIIVTGKGDVNYSYDAGGISLRS